MQPIRIAPYQRRRDHQRRAEPVSIRPAEHPATTMQRDALGAREPDVVRYPSSWDCPRCRQPNPLGSATCGICGAAVRTAGDRR